MIWILQNQIFAPGDALIRLINYHKEKAALAKDPIR